jgi:hypothetical protein
MFGKKWFFILIFLSSCVSPSISYDDFDATISIPLNAVFELSKFTNSGELFVYEETPIHLGASIHNKMNRLEIISESDSVYLFKAKLPGETRIKIRIFDLQNNQFSLRPTQYYQVIITE